MCLSTVHPSIAVEMLPVHPLLKAFAPLPVSDTLAASLKPVVDLKNDTELQ